MHAHGSRAAPRTRGSVPRRATPAGACRQSVYRSPSRHHTRRGRAGPCLIDTAERLGGHFREGNTTGLLQIPQLRRARGPIPPAVCHHGCVREARRFSRSDCAAGAACGPRASVSIGHVVLQSRLRLCSDTGNRSPDYALTGTFISIDSPAPPFIPAARPRCARRWRPEPVTFRLSISRRHWPAEADSARVTGSCPRRAGSVAPPRTARRRQTTAREPSNQRTRSPNRARSCRTPARRRARAP